MTNTTDTYLLTNNQVEQERLRVQSHAWEGETEALLDQIGIKPGWHCLDLGCGSLGILGPLSRRAGPHGRVVGLDNNLTQLFAARAYAEDEMLFNVDLLEGDAYNTKLPAASFDLVHVRFVFAPVGNDQVLLREMLRLVRPGGILVIQEPDAASWDFFPGDPAWKRLKEAILGAFCQGGGDFNAGRRTYAMLRDAGCRDVRIRSAVLAMQNCHPYMRLPVNFAASLRPRILASSLLSEQELDESIAACERLASSAEAYMQSFITTQVWARKQ